MQVVTFPLLTDSEKKGAKKAKSSNMHGFQEAGRG